MRSVLLQEHQLCIEQEAAIFGQVTCCPLDREKAKTPDQTSLLTSSCEGDDGVQVSLPFASGTRSTHWRQFGVVQRSDACFASLLPHRITRHFVAPSTPSGSRRLGAFRTGGMSSNARAPWDEGCGPVPSADAHSFQILLDLEESAMTKILGNYPLEFNYFSIDS